MGRKVIYKLPDIGEGIAEGEIVKWLVKEGDRVKQFQPVVEVLTAKAKVELPSPYEGRIVKLMAGEGDVVQVGEPLMEIEVFGEGEVGGEKVETARLRSDVEEVYKEEVRPRDTAERVEVRRIRAPPAVRLLARKMNIDLSTVKGSGPRGIITRRDVLEAAEKRVEKAEAPEEKVERVKIRGIRRFMYKNMSKAKSIIPHAYLIEEVDVTELWRLRDRLKDYASERGVKLTILPFIVKAVTIALKEYPYLNASVDEEKEEIILKKYYNIGIAVDAEDGLVVPNIKDADKKSILDIAREIRELADKARKGALELRDVQDGTFSITNIGAIGSIAGMAVINYPEVAILGIHRTFERPIYRDGKIENRKFLYLSISFDHRILEGAYVTRFLNRLKELLEEPGKILIE